MAQESSSLVGAHAGHGLQNFCAPSFGFVFFVEAEKTFGRGFGNQSEQSAAKERFVLDFNGGSENGLFVIGGEFLQSGLQEQRELDAFVVEFGEPASLGRQRPLQRAGFVSRTPASRDFSEALEKMELAHRVFGGEQFF